MKAGPESERGDAVRSAVDPPGGALGAIGEGLAELSLGPGERDLSLGFGGDAANVCVMAARLGAPARLAGRVGSDGLGDRLLGFWRRSGVDVTALRRDPDAATGLYLNEPAGDGDHRFTYWRRGSAGSRVGADELDEPFFDGLGVLVFTGVTLAVSASSVRAAEHAIPRARARGARIACVLNHRPALGGDVGALAEAASSSDIVIGSREDAEAVFGVADPAALAGRSPFAAELVLSDGPRPATVTCGDHGANQPVPGIAVRNAAGAGDALAGAYLASRLLRRPPAEALTWAVAAATLSVEREGCAASYPSVGRTAALARKLRSAATAPPASAPAT